MRTPRTIEEAIENGIEEFAEKAMLGMAKPMPDHIRSHVRDFIAQRCTLQSDEVIEVFKRIFPEVGPRNIEDLSEEDLNRPH